MYLSLILVGWSGTFMWGTPWLLSWVLDYSRKNPKKGWVDDIYTFLKKPVDFIYFSLYPYKTSFHPWKFHNLCYTAWNFQDQKSKSNGKSTWLFLERLQEINLHFGLYYPLTVSRWRAVIDNASCLLSPAMCVLQCGTVARLTEIYNVELSHSLISPLPPRCGLPFNKLR